MCDIAAIIRRRIARRPLLLDGATGTELARRGVSTRMPLWSAAALREAPDVIADIHREYVAAGADLIVANTFRTNPRCLKRAGWLQNGAALNRLAVELARSAATAKDLRPGGGEPVLVAASVAPAEDCYHPERVPAVATLAREHGLLVDWLEAAGPDLLWIETMNTVREAEAAARAARDARLPFAVSFVVREDGDLLSGEPLEAAVASVEAYGPVAVGLNCIPPRGMTARLPRLRSATKLPLAAYAHLGNPEPIQGWSFSSEMTGAAYVGEARIWVSLGASIVGGCCGTTPEHVRSLRRYLDSEFPPN